MCTVHVFAVGSHPLELVEAHALTHAVRSVVSSVMATMAPVTFGVLIGK